MALIMLAKMPENQFKFKMYFDISKSHDVKIPQNIG